MARLVECWLFCLANDAVGSHCQSVAEVSINSIDELRQWLQGKPAVWSRLLAIRSTLRVFPFALATDDIRGKKSAAAVNIAVFQGMSLTYGAAVFWIQQTAEDDFDVVISKMFSSAAIAYTNAFSGDVSTGGLGPKAAEGMAAGALGYFASFESDQYVMCGTAADGHDGAGVALRNIWSQISQDCAVLDLGAHPLELLEKPIWAEIPDWFRWRWLRIGDWIARNADGEVIKQWYEARLLGYVRTFPGFSGKADRKFTERLFAQDDEWWKREPETVYAEIGGWVEELRSSPRPDDAALTQNPLVLTFSIDEDGRSILDPEVAPNGLQDDADARDNHAEILRLIDKALSSTRDAPTQQVAIAEPTEFLREAMGKTVSDLRPRIFVLRARELMRQVADLEDASSLGVPLSDEQRKAFLPLVDALTMLKDFDPKLAQLWSGKIGGDNPPLAPEQLQAIVDALRDSGQTEAATQEILGTAVDQVASNADEMIPQGAQQAKCCAMFFARWARRPKGLMAWSNQGTAGSKWRSAAPGYGTGSKTRCRMAT